MLRLNPVILSCGLRVYQEFYAYLFRIANLTNSNIAINAISDELFPCQAFCRAINHTKINHSLDLTNLLFSHFLTTAKANKHAGGNPYCPRPTPEWQAEITKFFIKTPKEPKLDKENQDPEDAGAGSSKMEE